MSKVKQKSLRQLALEHNINYKAISHFKKAHPELILDINNNENIIKSYIGYNSNKTIVEIAREKGLSARSIYNFKREHPELISDISSNECIVQSYINNKTANKEKLKLSRQTRIGETQLMKCGLKATVIEYNSARDITIRFEDNTVRKHVKWADFSTGAVGHPNINMRGIQTKSYRVGETQLMQCGLKAKIIEYNSAEDMTIQFEYGVIKEHVGYRAFKDGVTQHPNEYNRLGEEKTMKCGFKAKIIEYNRCDNITIQFKDGTIRKNIAYSEFKDGKIAKYPPELDLKDKEIKKLTKAEIIGIIKFKERQNIQDIKEAINAYKQIVEVTDKLVEEFRMFDKRAFNYNRIANICNRYSIPYKEYIKVFRLKQKKENMQIIKKEFSNNEEHYFLCKCNKCGFSNILTLDEALEHKC